ncbi:hypothetical protein L596_003241 [Steinernema carpocapsae]|uniref:FERM domain-containing protein n=1 Tax=Steinernema carpocapsae TaxID=34508 RepID=A0A4U8US32_STECR|nr:hypothetical protein L596_003241 [Steinernema carpocapsae]
MGDFGVLEAKARFLSILEKWPLFGCSFFYVRQLLENQQEVDMILSINKRGLRLNRTRDNSTAIFIPFSQVKSTDKIVTERKQCLNITIEGENPPQVLYLETESGGEISRLIGQYLFIGEEYHGTVLRSQ